MFNPGNMAFQQAKGAATFKYASQVPTANRLIIQVFPDPKMMRGGKAHMLMFVDAASNRFKQMTMTMTGLSGPNVPAGAPNKMDMKMVVQSESANAPISDSIFKLNPRPEPKN